MDDRDLVRLPTDALKKQGFKSAAARAKAVADQGGSPRAQIDAARPAAGGERLNYLPHQGAKERARMRARAEKAAAKVRGDDR